LSGTRVKAIRTPDGSIEADVVIAACGIDTPRLAAFAGVDVPLKDAPGVLAFTKPMPRLVEPIVLAPGAHFKQYADGRIVTGSDFGGAPLLDGERLIPTAAEFLPNLRNAVLDHVAIGHRVMPLDEYPIIGLARPLKFWTEFKAISLCHIALSVFSGRLFGSPSYNKDRHAWGAQLQLCSHRFQSPPQLTFLTS
jgi:glycine/D-amino acid oxidase-like deaminating enzyme